MRLKLSQRLTLVFIIPIIVLVVVQIVYTANLQEQQRQEREAHYQSVMRSVSTNLDLILDGISKSATTFSYSPIVRSYLSPDAEAAETARLRDYIYELSVLSRKYNVELAELMLSHQGNVESLVGYYSKELYDFVTENTANANDADTNQYYVLDVTSQGYTTTYIVYIMPVFNIRASHSSGRVLGHVAVICTVRNIYNALSVGEDVVVELCERGGGVLLSSAGADAAERDEAYYTSYTQPLADSNMELRFAFRNTGGGLWYGSASLLFWFVLVLVFLIYIMFATHLIIIRPVHRLNLAISEIKNDYPNKMLDVPSNDEIGSIAVHINEMLSEINALNLDVMDSQINLYEAEIEKNKSQIYAFQNQVNPHFLFNTLQCIRSKALLNNEEEIATMCGDISLILRHGLSSNEMVPLQKELSITEKYLELIKIRYENRITYDILVDDESLLWCQIPKMILQPLVENAIYHGLEPLPHPGHIQVRVARGDGVRITVADNGIGFDPERLAEIEQQMQNAKLERYFSGEREDHIGVINVHQRIRLLYGDEYGLQIARADGRTVVTLHLSLS